MTVIITRVTACEPHLGERAHFAQNHKLILILILEFDCVLSFMVVLNAMANKMA